MRVTVLVFGALAGALVLTGFASSAYKHERILLGQEHYAEGCLLRSKGALTAANEQYRQALIYSPDEFQYRLALAQTLIEAGHLDEAQAHLEQLIEEDPTNGVLNLMMARLALKRRKSKEAVEYYQRAVYEYWPPSEIPQRRQARWELAGLLDRTGNRNGYIAELMQLYAGTPPKDEKQLLEIGNRLRRAGATSEAVQLFRQVLKSFPQSADAYRGLGNVSFDAGDYVSARHDFQHALKIAPRDKSTTASLELTNEIIDLDPALPDISAAERLRRSQNLLARVLRDIDACAPPSLLPKPEPAPARTKSARQKKNHEPVAPTNPLTDRLSAAEKMLSAHPPDADDLPFQMQQTAGQLWKDRSQFCSGGATQDSAVNTVLTRLGDE